MQVNKTNYFLFPPFTNHANNLAQNSLKIRNLSNLKRIPEFTEKQNQDLERNKNNKIPQFNKKLEQLPQSKSLAQLGSKIIQLINSPTPQQMGILHSKSPIRGIGSFPKQNYNFNSSKYQLNFDKSGNPHYNFQNNKSLSSRKTDMSNSKL